MKIIIKSSSIFKLVLSMVVSVMLFGCQDYWPTEEWRSAEPEEKGMDSEKLQQAQQLASEVNVWSMIVVKEGYIVSEGYYNGGSQDLSARVNSVTKSIVSLSAGIAQDKGYIDIDQTLAEYFPEYIGDDADEWEKNIIIKDLLTMSWGYNWNNWDMGSGGKYWQWYYSPDQLQYAVDREQAATPGEVWNYDCSSSQFISALITKTTGQTTKDFTQQNLFDPLGINSEEGEETQWSANKDSGITDGAFGLYMTPRQMAKIGLLMVNDGEWDGRQVVSKEWVEQSRSPLIENSYGGSYGLYWWVNPASGAYWASGTGGQYIIMFPEDDLIIVLTSLADIPAALDPDKTLSTANMVSITTLVKEAIIGEEE
ncbi:MAG: class C beta-lactamase-related serine hydrolase [Gammaproteobacteria bacterium]|nr:MAG: class C beta-lactamase-related serine hydrolase [Gammaproteobacteria bacterium]